MAEERRTLVWRGHPIHIRMVDGKFRWDDLFGGFRQDGLLAMAVGVPLGVIAHFTHWWVLGLFAMCLTGVGLLYLTSYVRWVSLAKTLEARHGDRAAAMRRARAWRGER